MPNEILSLLLPLITVTGIILLAYLSTKWLAKKYQNSASYGKHIKIIERIALSKDSSLVLVEIAEKKYLLSVSAAKTDVLIEFKEGELNELSSGEQKKDFASFMFSATGSSSYLDFFKSKKDKKKVPNPKEDER